MSTASAATSAEIAAGTVLVARMPPSWTFSVTRRRASRRRGRARRSPTPRARTAMCASRIAGGLADGRQTRDRVVAGADQRLALAVIAEAPGLEDRRPAGPGQRRVDVGLLRRPRRKARTGMPSAGDKPLLGEAVLGDSSEAERREDADAVPRGSATVAAGMFSNSKVTMSTAPAKAASADSSS